MVKKKHVIFVGHSLGGALATLCFCIYRNLPSRFVHAQEVRLVTFAAPRVGNKIWVQAFEKEFDGDHFHFVHEHDVVPMLPPARHDPDEFERLSRCGIGGKCLIVVNLFWRRFYERFWRPEPYWNYSKDSKTVKVLKSPKNPNALDAVIGNHEMTAYRDSVFTLTK